MIHISKTYFEHTEGISRLCARITIGNRSTVLWFGVKEAQEEYLSAGRSDPFVMALLPSAMRQNLDIECEDPVSEKLHHQLRYELMPSLMFSGNLYHNIKINAPLINKPYPSKGAVATGFSGGVDSFYTIYKHNRDSEYPLTHLSVFNSGVYEGELYRPDFQKACDACEAFAAENGYDTVFVDSNVYDVLRYENYIEICTFRLLACTMAIQGLVSVYLLSSGFHISDFSMSVDHAACFDPLTIFCACTESQLFLQTGVDVKRVEKLEAISDYAPSFNWLSMCAFGKPGKKNCGRCKKCMWDMAELYAIGKLDNYKNVFDINEYKQNLPQRLGFVLSYDQDPFCRDVIELMKEKKTEIPKMAYRCAEMFKKAKAVQEKLGKKNG